MSLLQPRSGHSHCLHRPRAPLGSETCWCWQLACAALCPAHPSLPLSCGSASPQPLFCCPLPPRSFLAAPLFPEVPWAALHLPSWHVHGI